jgi:pimeloyl-ACP methyl ester carboxylesterase
MAGLQKQKVALFSETLRLAFTNHGEGRAFLILHGGAGSASVSGLADVLAQDAHAIVPTHPGFDGEPRPDWFARIDDLVLAYLALIEQLTLSNVVVVGNSVGGWIAAEMALRKSPRLAGIVLLDAVGIDTGSVERPIVDPMKLAPAERSALAFHDPQRFAIAPSGPEAAAAMANNQQTLRVYAGEPFMHDLTLRVRLAQMSIPALVAWGESDRIVDVAYGQRYASSIPGARFELVPEAAHFPQIERLDVVVQLIHTFITQL